MRLISWTLQSGSEHKVRYIFILCYTAIEVDDQIQFAILLLRKHSIEPYNSVSDANQSG